MGKEMYEHVIYRIDAYSLLPDAEGVMQGV